MDEPSFEKEWEVYQNGRRLGPFSRGELVRQLQEGDFPPDVSVNHPNLEGWETANTVQPLIEHEAWDVQPPQDSNWLQVPESLKRFGRSFITAGAAVLLVVALLGLAIGLTDFAEPLKQYVRSQLTREAPNQTPSDLYQKPLNCETTSDSMPIRQQLKDQELPAPPDVESLDQFIEAYQNRNREQVQLYLKAGLRDIEPEGGSILHRIARDGHAGLLRELLSCEWDLHEPREDSLTPLDLAVVAGHDSVVRLLLEADSDTTPDATLENPVREASAQARPSILKRLRQHGGPFNLLLKGSNPLATPLNQFHRDVRATNWGRADRRLEVLRQMLEVRPAIARPTSTDTGPLSVALKSFTKTVVPDSSRPSSTWLDTGAVQPAVDRTQKLLRLLLNHGADPNQSVRLRETTYDSPLLALLTEATGRHNQESLKALEPDDRKHYGGLLQNLRSATPRLVTTLLEQGADPNQTNAEGKSSLHLAVARHAEEVVELLLEAGAQPNAQDRNGQTPLHEVAQAPAEFAEPRIRRLIDSGADPNRRNNDGITPAEYARSLGNAETARVLDELSD